MSKYTVSVAFDTDVIEASDESEALEMAYQAIEDGDYTIELEGVE